MGLPSLRDNYIDASAQDGVHGQAAWGLESTVLSIFDRDPKSVGTGSTTSPSWVPAPSPTLVHKPLMHAPDMQGTCMLRVPKAWVDPGASPGSFAWVCRLAGIPKI